MRQMPLLLCVVLTAVGCSASPPGPPPPPPAAPADADADAAAAAPSPATTPAAAAATPDVVRPAADGSATLQVGQVLEIALEGNASTGYGWEIVEDGAPMLQRATLPPPAPAPAGDKAGPRLVGSPSVSRWHFQATTPGEARLRLVYRRAWEKDVAPAREAAFKVVVQPAG